MGAGYGLRVTLLRNTGATWDAGTPDNGGLRTGDYDCVSM